MVSLQGWPAASDEMDNDYDGEVDEPGEEAGLSHFMQWCGDEDIHRAWQKYNTMTGFCRNGEPLTFGGRGTRGTTRIRSQWPGDPVTGAYWSAVNIDSMGTELTSARPGSVSSFGPFRLGPGEFAEFTFAYVWAQGEDNFDSITKLRRGALALQKVYGLYFVNRAKLTPPILPFPSNNLMHGPHPNPATDYVTVRYTVAETAAVRLELYDVLGRSAKVFVNEIAHAGDYVKRISVLDLTSGVYVYRASIGRATATGTLVITK